MKLRSRLLVTLLLMMVPLFAGMFWLRYETHKRASITYLRDFTTAVFNEEERAACEASPARWQPFHHAASQPTARLSPPQTRGRFARRPPSFFVYDQSLAPLHEDAPTLDGSLVEEMTTAGFASRHFDRVTEVLVRTPWNGGPCAYVLARHQPPDDTPSVIDRALSDAIWPAVLTAMMAFILWFTLGAHIDRLRTLSLDVQAVAKGQYRARLPVKGTDEVTDLARAFNTASEQVQEYIQTVEDRERTLREFLANTTHDVMIPLTVMQGALARLKGGPGDEALICSVREEAYFIASLLSNLSAVAKLEAGESYVHRAPIVLNPIAERSVERYRSIAAEHGVELNLATDEAALTVNADPTLTEQCLSNLIYNAVRYNKSGGHVAVILKKQGMGFDLRVVDDGPGMSLEERQRALERGFRGQGAVRDRPEGGGLGLSIVNQVAKLHGWKFELQASEYGGLQACVSGQCME